MTHEHMKNDSKFKYLKYSIVIISDSRYQQVQKAEEVDDLTIPKVKSILNKNKQHIQSIDIIPDDIMFIEKKICQIIKEYNPDIIITSGGTGIGKRDVTIETMSNLFEKELPGFGELFRRLSFDQVGVPTILSRAMAGIFKNTLIFNLPGNPNAVELALNKIIIPIAPHSISMLR
ncbi:MAG: molybdenum cofactor biosynthesis protein MoaB [Promethearchaeota archaeon]|nr:MAG: molybdenum cofactor biosynthesis protein MoaB [Candidatus Lokiarchaeota archaeon]